MTSEFLTLDETAERARVSVSTVRYWIRQKKLASVRPGRRRLVRRVDLDRLLGGETAPPAPSLPEPVATADRRA
jgi:excisionase family DNA binding protein